MALNSELEFCSMINDQLNQNVNHRDTEDDGISPESGEIPIREDNGNLHLILQKHKALSNTDVIRDVSISSDLELGLVANSVNSVRKHDKHNKDHSVWFGAFSEDRLLINLTNVFLNLVSCLRYF